MSISGRLFTLISRVAKTPASKQKPTVTSAASVGEKAPE